MQKEVTNDAPPQHILIVDDQPANLRLLATMLRQHGYKVNAVTNGKMALQSVQLAPPDAILLDINMPEMNGYEVCECLKADKDMCDIPVIFISALDEVVDKVKAFHVGGADYVTKPFQMEEVLARLQNQLMIRNLQQQLQQANAELEQRVDQRTRELATAHTRLEKVHAAHERFVPREFLQLLDKDDITVVQLGDQVQREMTVMLVDIHVHTTSPYELSAPECFVFINSYLSRMSPIIRHHSGFIDKYIDDAIIALFPHRASDALQAALGIVEEVNLYNIYSDENGNTPVTIGISLHTDILCLGIIGERHRMQGVVFGNAYNIAARLGDVARLYEATIVLSKPTLRQGAETLDCRCIDKLFLNETSESMPVFELLQSDIDELAERKQMTKSDFEAGIQLYHDRDFAQAHTKFSTVLQQNPHDKAAQVYLEWSTYCMQHNVSSMKEVCIGSLLSRERNSLP